MSVSTSLTISASTEGTTYLQEAVDLALACHQTVERGRDQEEILGAVGVSWGSLWRTSTELVVINSFTCVIGS